MPFALAWEAFKAFGIWRKIGGAFGTAWRWITASKVHLLLAALAIVGAWGWLGWHGKAKAEKVLHSTEAAFDAYRVQVAKASEDNRRAQAAQDADTATVQAERNRRTADVSKASEQARVGAVDSYFAAHRVQRASCDSPAATADVHPDTAKRDDPAAPDNLATISRPDLDGLTQDAVQGAVRLRYLESLVASGQAVVVPDTEKN